MGVQEKKTKKEELAEKIAEDELIKYSQELNNQLRDEFELEEVQNRYEELMMISVSIE